MLRLFLLVLIELIFAPLLLFELVLLSDKIQNISIILLRLSLVFCSIRSWVFTVDWTFLVIEIYVDIDVVDVEIT